MDKTEKLNKIKHYANILGDIFDGVNKEVCSDCPKARSKTIEDAYKNMSIASKEAGCCSRCKRQSGYLNYKRQPELKKKFNFDKKYGFFDNDKKTCKLPRYLRSIDCLYYTCYSLRNKLQEKHGNRIRHFIACLVDEIHKLRV